MVIHTRCTDMPYNSHLPVCFRSGYRALRGGGCDWGWRKRNHSQVCIDFHMRLRKTNTTDNDSGGQKVCVFGLHVCPPKWDTVGTNYTRSGHIFKGQSHSIGRCSCGAWCPHVRFKRTEHFDMLLMLWYSEPFGLSTSASAVTWLGGEPSY